MTDSKSLMEAFSLALHTFNIPSTFLDDPSNRYDSPESFMPMKESR